MWKQTTMTYDSLYTIILIFLWLFLAVLLELSAWWQAAFVVPSPSDSVTGCICGSSYSLALVSPSYFSFSPALYSNAICVSVLPPILSVFMCLFLLFFISLFILLLYCSFLLSFIHVCVCAFSALCLLHKTIFSIISCVASFMSACLY